MNKRNLLLAPALAFALGAGAQTQLDFDLARRGPVIPQSLFGIFFEEINHGGDGGLYAELVQNRSFEYSATSADCWTASGGASCTVVSNNLLNSAQGHALLVTFSGSSSTLSNSGYWGMKFEAGRTYHISFWAKSVDTRYQGNIVARLMTDTGERIGFATLSGPFATEWTKYEADIEATENCQSGYLELRGSRSGNIMLDVVSLMPPTYNGHANGTREDLTQMLADLHPAFVRFPGGCYVEGNFVDNKDNRFVWKNTIGPIEERPGHMNYNWGYRVEDGLGYHEYLQLCEDLDAEPLFVVNMGMGHGWVVDYDKIDDYVQEALDAVEYANGDTTTTYGRLRAQNGHPEPFNLRYIEIGNENYNFIMDSNADQSDHYPERYYQFYKALKAAWPDVELIGNVEAWGTDAPSWRNTYPVEIVDEHYYRSPSWFVSNYNKYDTYSRANGKVYVGEYAVTIGYGTLGSLNSALGEAVFMQGMERNSDVVAMASYAPLFCNDNAQMWMPDIIRFDCYRAMGTPSYYVQQLFGQNRGHQNVLWTETDNEPVTAADVPGQVGVGTWSTAATFSDLRVVDNHGNVLLDGAASSAADYATPAGTWSFESGTWTETATDVEPATCVFSTAFDADTLIYTLNATKQSGAEGFLIIFNYRDANNFTWWNLGGWGNTAHAVEDCVDGGKTTKVSAAGSLTTGQTYAIRIEKEGQHVRCYLDDVLVHDFTLTTSYDRGVYTSAALTEDESQLIVKLTNPNPNAQPTHLSFANGRVTGASLQLLTSASGTDENSMDNPLHVVPQTGSVTVNADGTIDYLVPAFSFNVLTLDVADVGQPSQEPSTLPLPAVVYTFEDGQPADDSGTYPAQLGGGSALVTLADGNRAFYSGAIGTAGYLDLGTDMPRDVLGGVTDEYTISLDLLPLGDNCLGSFCWALTLANGTSEYLGLINAGGGANWYFEAKADGQTVSVPSYSRMATRQWHNLCVTHQSDTTRLYIDGRLYVATPNALTPAAALVHIAGAYLARSPFEADAYMENTCFDNLQIFRQALTAAQVAALAQTATTLAGDEIGTPLTIGRVETGSAAAGTDRSAQAYDLTGRAVQRVARPGIYIVGGQKVAVKP